MQRSILGVMCAVWALSVTAHGQIMVGGRVGVTASGNPLNVRSTACGAVVGSVQSGVGGQVVGGSQGCNGLTWWQVSWQGVQGWSAQGANGATYLVPLPGSGVYPSVSAPQAYTVQVGPDATGLNVRSGPGTNYPIIGSVSAGATGTTLAVFNDTAQGIVWWRVRWSNGLEGWSAEGIRGAGIYLTRVSQPPIGSEDQLLYNLVAPYRTGQAWIPSTYDGHTGQGILYAVDFNRVSGSRATCAYQTGFLEDCGEVIVASHAGRVYNRAQSGCLGYGNYVVVVSNVLKSGTTNSYVSTIYAHLNHFLAPNGSTVGAGAPIGRLGSTGNSTGPHLHYELRYMTVQNGSITAFGNRIQVLNNPRIRMSGQPLRVDTNCRLSGLGYVGPPITGTASVSSVPANIAGRCSPYPNCPNRFDEGDSEIPTEGGDRSVEPLPEEIIIYLADIDGNGCVDDADLIALLIRFGETVDSAEDINWDGIVDDADLIALLMDFGAGCSNDT
ncbi:MAG: peptidoglycan DD-metalloendopeptidase family protein [Fimbriimonadales bacterium]